jgi:probable rRNA maturation factor
MPVETDYRDGSRGAETVGFEALLAPVAAELGCQPLVSLVLCGDDEIAALNAQWLSHDGPTDVISFPQLELIPGVPSDELRDGVLLGDIVISVETAAGQAAEFDDWSTADEVALLFVHGLLHLCGYDDLSDEARAVMTSREAEVLTATGRRPAPGRGGSA